MIQPARFLDIARRRLDLVIEALTAKAPKKTIYTLSWSANVECPASDLGKYLYKIYNSVFDPKRKTRYLFEALAGRNMRAALEMFVEIVMSPHFETDKIWATRMKEEPDELPELMLVRILMRRHYQYFQVRQGNFITNLFDVDRSDERMSLFLLPILLDRLCLDRKKKGELNIEGYRHVEKLIEEMTNQGFLAEDVLWGLGYLLERNLIIADHQRADRLDRDDYVKITASGHYHMVRLLGDWEYINGMCMDVWLRDRPTAETLCELGDLRNDNLDVNQGRIRAKVREFSRAINEEARIHAEQCAIDAANNTLLSYILNKVNRASFRQP